MRIAPRMCLVAAIILTLSLPAVAVPPPSYPTTLPGTVTDGAGATLLPNAAVAFTPTGTFALFPQGPSGSAILGNWDYQDDFGPTGLMFTGALGAVVPSHVFFGIYLTGFPFADFVFIAFWDGQRMLIFTTGQ